MLEVIKVVFRNGGKHYIFSSSGLDIEPRQWVVIETDNGSELGKSISHPQEFDESEFDKQIKSIARIATEEDLEQYAKNKKFAWKYFDICKKLIKELSLEMKLINADLSLDGKHVTFHFTAEQRIDFRELLKKLCSRIKKKIELRQVGVRDEAKIVGGFGSCGCFMCCTQFLSDFAPVSIKMAKEQNLPLNPSKISGVCGRLMCCLKYESDCYKDFMEKAPGKGTEIKLPQGTATIVDFNVIKESAILSLENGLCVEMPVAELPYSCGNSGNLRAPV